MRKRRGAQRQTGLVIPFREQEESRATGERRDHRERQIHRETNCISSLLLHSSSATQMRFLHDVPPLHAIHFEFRPALPGPCLSLPAYQPRVAWPAKNSERARNRQRFMHKKRRSSVPRFSVGLFFFVFFAVRPGGQASGRAERNRKRARDPGFHKQVTMRYSNDR